MAVVPCAVFILVSTKESRDGLDVRDVVLLAIGVELGQESSISVKKETSGSEEEVRVLFVLWKLLVWPQRTRCVFQDILQIGATSGSGNERDLRC